MTNPASAAKLILMSFRIFFRLIAALFLFYSLQRGLFVFWNRSQFMDSPLGDLFWAAFTGLRFDMVAISWIVILTLIWAWGLRRALWLVPLGLGILLYGLALIDNEVSNFFGRRLTWSVMQLFSEAQGKVAGMAGSYVFWILLGWILGAPFFVWIFRILKNEKSSLKRGPQFWLKQSAMVLILLVMSRGGFQKKPLSMIHSQVFDHVPLNLMVVNTTFSLVKSLSKSGGLPRVQFMESAQAFELTNSQLGREIKPSPFDKKNPPNVVLIILESFSWEYTALNPDLKEEITPFLNSLMKKSAVYANSFANGRRSIEGIAAILAGVPTLMEEPFIKSEYAAVEIEGIAHHFNQKGFATSFYHGGENGTMHFDSFTQKLGFKKYFGLSEYPNKSDHDGVWGVWDRPYLRYYADQLAKETTPFFSVMFTLSSHHPYHVPESERDRFAEHPGHPILKSIQYTDSALEEFFKKASSQPWYSNALFVLLADHTGPVVFQDKNNPLAEFRIPILFFSPQIRNWKYYLNTQELAQQADLPGTLYDLVGISGAKVTPFGRSLLRPGPRSFLVFDNGRFLVTDLQQTQVIYPDKVKASPYLDWRTDQIPRNELTQSQKAHYQIFSESLWNNQLFRK